MIGKIPSQQHVLTATRTNGMNQSGNYPRQGKELGQKDIQQQITQEKWAKVAYDKEKVQDVVEAMNNFLQPVYTSLKFEMHDKLGEYYVQIIDDNTQEVIREIPPKKLLDMYAAMAELIGLVVDKKI